MVALCVLKYSSEYNKFTQNMAGRICYTTLSMGRSNDYVTYTIIRRYSLFYAWPLPLYVQSAPLPLAAPSTCMCLCSSLSLQLPFSAVDYTTI